MWIKPNFLCHIFVNITRLSLVPWKSSTNDFLCNYFINLQKREFWNSSNCKSFQSDQSFMLWKLHFVIQAQLSSMHSEFSQKSFNSKACQLLYAAKGSSYHIHKLSRRYERQLAKRELSQALVLRNILCQDLGSVNCKDIAWRKKLQMHRETKDT